MMIHKRRPVLGHSLNVIIAICASILSGFVIYANNLLPTTLINKLEFDSIKQQLSYSYFATYQHMGPYCLGLFVGYILHKRPAIRLPTHLTWLLWLLLPPLSFTTLLLTYLWNGAYKEPSMINPSPLVSAFYIAIHRTIWSSLTAWIVFACVTRRAKLLSAFLSHHYFVPISRLSFSIYLVHMPLIMYRALNMRHTKEWTDGNILWEACGNFVTSCLLGYFLNVCFESPFINLEQALLGPPKLVSTRSPLIASSASNSSNCVESDSSANNSPSIPKRSDTQAQRAVKSASLADTDSSHSDRDDEAKQIRRLVDDELFTIEYSFNPARKPQLRRTIHSNDQDGEEIYQLESENYHHQQHNYLTRPAHYATLARTSRFSNQEMSAILSHRQVPIKNNQRDHHQQQQAATLRRKARYNTLTSAHDWANQQDQSSFDWDGNQALSVPQPHYMIPRIEPSTLTRPRSATKHMASSRFQAMVIAEEPPISVTPATSDKENGLQH